MTGVFLDKKIVVDLNGKETTLVYESGYSLLDMAIKADLEPPYSCREGVCSTCEATLIEGQVDTEVVDGKILTCQAMPKSDCPLVKIRY